MKQPLDISRCPFTVKTRVRKKAVRSHRVVSATRLRLPVSGSREKTRTDSLVSGARLKEKEEEERT